MHCTKIVGLLCIYKMYFSYVVLLHYKLSFFDADTNSDRMED